MSGISFFRKANYRIKVNRLLIDRYCRVLYNKTIQEKYFVSKKGVDIHVIHRYAHDRQTDRQTDGMTLIF